MAIRPVKLRKLPSEMDATDRAVVIANLKKKFAKATHGYPAGACVFALVATILWLTQQEEADDAFRNAAVKLLQDTVGRIPHSEAQSILMLN